MSAQPANLPKRRSRVRQMASVASLDLLIGAHPDSLRDFYEAGTPFDPSAIAQSNSGDASDGQDMPARLLAIDALDSAYMLTRPLLIKVAHSWLPWRGTHFESGGTAGSQRFAAGRAWRFSAEAGPSRLDDAPCLLLRYAALGNPRWVARFEQELRRVGDHVVMGPLFRGERTTPIAWTGLSTL